MRRTWIRWRAFPPSRGAAGSGSGSFTPKVTVSHTTHSQQRRIRQLMVQHVLLATEPLTPKTLVGLVDASFAPEFDATNPIDGAEAMELPNHVRNLRSFFPRDITEDAGEASVVGPTVQLLLSVDSQFRVSPAGYVCYPTLPSLLVASTNVEGNDAWILTARRLVCPGKEATNLTIKEWSYMLSLWCMLDTEAEEPNVSLNTSDKQHAIHDSVSSELVKHWMRFFDEPELPPLLCGKTTQLGGALTPSSPSGVSGTQPRSMPRDLQESTDGNDTLRQWCLEAKEGYLCGALMNAPHLSLATRFLQLVNEQIGVLIGCVIGAPISISRLSVLVQWSSLPFAQYYRSLLHLLLLFVGGPTMTQIERHAVRRREARKKWIALLLDCPDAFPSRHGKRTSVAKRYASQEAAEEEDEEAEMIRETREKEEHKWNEKEDDNNTEMRHDCSATSIKTREMLNGHWKHWRRSTCWNAVTPRYPDTYNCFFFRPNGIPLNTSTQSPTEILDTLLKEIPVSPSGPTNAMVDDKEEEATNGIIIFGGSRYVFERRIAHIVRMWWALVGQHEHTPCPQFPTITVRRLCQVCLWEHEYGETVACRMMWHYLHSSIEVTSAALQLVPPVEESLSDEGNGKSREVQQTGRWLVVLHAPNDKSGNTSQQ